MQRTIAFLLALSLGLVVLSGVGCSRKTSAKGSGNTGIQLELEAIDLAPGATKEIKVDVGKAAKVEVKDKEVTAKIEGDKVIITASKSARRPCMVRVVDVRSQDAWVKVNIVRPRA